MELIYFLFSLLTCITLHLALGGYTLHKLAFPSFFFPLILYICNQILAVDVSDITHAVQKDPLLIWSLCAECHFPYMEVNHFQCEWLSAKKKHPSLLCYVTDVAVLHWGGKCDHLLYLYSCKELICLSTLWHVLEEAHTGNTDCAECSSLKLF